MFYIEFFIKNSEIKYDFQIGMQITFSTGIKGTVKKIEGENVYLEVTGEDEKYLRKLYEEKIK